jgi:hypothetical protein
MSLEKSIQKLTNAITAAKRDSIQPLLQPSIIPGWRRLGDCPMRPVGGGQFSVDWTKVPVGACCFLTNISGQCAKQCKGLRSLSTVSIVGDGPCPQDGLFTGDSNYTPGESQISTM